MQYQKNDWQLQALATSDDGNHIAMSLYNWKDEANPKLEIETIILNDKGDIIYQIPVGFQQAIFNEANDFLLLINKNKSYLYNIKMKKQIGVYSTIKDENLFLNATFLPPSHTVALQEGTPGQGIPGSKIPWKYDNIYIRTIDKDGEELPPFLVENVTLYKPSLNYNKENQTLFIGHSTGWKLYKVEN
jgi:hypothetical protein